MNIAPKLFNCQVNTTYFIKNHDILINYFQEITNTPWSHTFVIIITHTLQTQNIL